MADPERTYPYVDRRDKSQPHCCVQESEISALKHENSALQKTMDGVSTKLDLILAQITKVAILEERHNTQAIDVTRAHSKISNVADELTALAKETRAFINYSQGRDKVLWAIGAAVCMLAIKTLFFAASHGMTP